MKAETLERSAGSVYRPAYSPQLDSHKSWLWPNQVSQRLAVWMLVSS